VGIRRTSDGARASGLPTLALDRSRYEPKEIVMNPIRHIRRVAGVLAGLAGALLAFAAAAPAAFASGQPPLPPGWNKHPPLPVHFHTVVVGGMPGWQITLIAVGAALLAATVAVLADRARASRRKAITAAA
jgi:hypothetical protein